MKPLQAVAEGPLTKSKRLSTVNDVYMYDLLGAAAPVVATGRSFTVKLAYSN